MTSSDDNSPGSPSDVPISPTEAVLSALREVAATLTDSGIRYALIGGLAVAMRGQVRATKDVDLLLSVPQLLLPKFLERVLERGFKLDVTESIRVWNADGLLQIVSPLGIRVDLLRSLADSSGQI